MAPAQSQCSADTVHIAAGRPSSAPLAMALLGLLGEAHPRTRSLWEPLGPQTLTQGAVGAALRRVQTSLGAHAARQLGQRAELSHSSAPSGTTASGSPTPQPGHRAVSSGTVAMGGPESLVQDAEGLLTLMGMLAGAERCCQVTNRFSIFIWRSSSGGGRH